MREKYAGFFHPAHEFEDHHSSHPAWRVTSNDWHIANRVSRLLGGKAQQHPSANGFHWTVETESARLRVALECNTESDIRFRLANYQELGLFQLTSKSQMLMSTLTKEVQAFSAAILHELSIEPIEFTTRNGVIVTYLRPVLLPSDK